MSQTLARWVSIVLHPFLVLGLLTVAALLRIDPQAATRVLPAFVLVVALVLGLSLQRARSGAWNTVDASDRRNRPLLYAIVLVLLALYAAWVRHSAPLLLPGVLALLGMCLVAAIANRWIKLSLHMACLAYAAVLAWALSMPLALAFAAGLPLLAASRLRLGRHVLAEVVVGTLLGAAAGAAPLLWR